MDAFWQDHLAHEPGLAPYLTVLARKFLRSGVIPQTVTLGAVPAQPPLRHALDFIFGGSDVTRGKVVVRLPERLRTTAALQSLAACLGLAPEPDERAEVAAAVNTAILRQGLQYPQYVDLLQSPQMAEAWARLFRQQAEAERLLHGLLRAVAILEGNQGAITLSQLGADALQDSKALRSGALLKLLITMLAWRAEAEEATPAQLLARFGVIGNPYTTLVLLYGPIAYEDTQGRVWDWPAQLHAAGQVAALTWEQVQAIRQIQLTGPVAGVITSENAAPFHRLVEARTPAVCVYTEGYPNMAVSRVLAHLAAAGLVARHWGDRDLDGLRIAACVARVIPVELYGQEPVVQESGALRPLTAPQRVRAQAYLDAHPDFPFRAALADTLQHGWVEQESFFCLSR
jgi:hypothetical protein